MNYICIHALARIELSSLRSRTTLHIIKGTILMEYIYIIKFTELANKVKIIAAFTDFAISVHIDQDQDSNLEGLDPAIP